MTWTISDSGTAKDIGQRIAGKASQARMGDGYAAAEEPHLTAAVTALQSVLAIGVEETSVVEYRMGGHALNPDAFEFELKVSVAESQANRLTRRRMNPAL